MNDPLLALMGLARRAGKLATGYEAVQESLRAGRARAVFIAGDISAKTAANIRFAAARQGVPVQTLPCGMEALSAAVGVRAGLAAVEDAGFAKGLLQRAPRAEDTKEEPIV